MVIAVEDRKAKLRDSLDQATRIVHFVDEKKNFFGPLNQGMMPVGLTNSRYHCGQCHITLHWIFTLKAVPIGLCIMYIMSLSLNVTVTYE